jgi:hypothetical protein
VAFVESDREVSSDTADGNTDRERFPSSKHYMKSVLIEDEVFLGGSERYRRSALDDASPLRK